MENSREEVQHRLQQVFLQLGNEIVIFERLMYKNTKQHRRALYFRRLCQVRRDLRLLKSAQLNDLVQRSVNLLTCKEDALGNAFRSKKVSKVSTSVKALRRRLFGIARLVEQMSGPLLNASSQVAGLLGQTFFMPFALTTISLLARFRVLLQQVLHDTVLIFNMLSTSHFQKQASSSSLFREPSRFNLKEKEADSCKKIPDYLDCKWDGMKLFLSSEFHVQQETETQEDVMRWFVEDRKSRKYDVFDILQPAGQSHLGIADEDNGNGTKSGEISAEVLKLADVAKSKGDGQMASVLDGTTEIEVMIPIKHADLMTNENRDICSNDEQASHDLHNIDPIQGQKLKGTLNDHDAFAGSNASISGSKRKVAYISVAKMDNDIKKPRAENPDPEKPKKDALFDLLVGLGGKTC